MITGRDIAKSLPKQYFGTLFIGGTLCAVTLKYVLGDRKISLITTVHAAAPQGPPQKPNKMKYTELPMYGDPAVQKYKEYTDNLYRCPERDRRLLREQIVPYTSSAKETADLTFCRVYYFIYGQLKSIYDAFEAQKKDIKAYARDPKNEQNAKIFVATSTLLAFYLAYRPRGHLHKGFFWGGLAVLFTGWLCFPVETDKRFREFCYTCLLIVVKVYNLFCGSDVKLGYGPCDMTPPPSMAAKLNEQAKLCPPKPKKPPEKPPPPKPVPKPPPKDIGTEDFECPYDD